MLSRLWHDTQANVMTIFAIAGLVILMLVAMAMALSMDTRAANELQFTADNAALGGARAFMMSDSQKLRTQIKEARVAARQLAKSNSDFQLSDMDVEAASEDNFGQNIRMSVELEFKPVNPTAELTQRSGNVEIRRKAVVEATRGFPLCVLTLAEEGTNFKMNANATFGAENCIVWSNSEGKRSMSFRGGAASARAFCTAGKIKQKEGIVTPQPETLCRQLPDPLAGLKIEVSSGCDYPKRKYGKKKRRTLKPGVYCNGLVLAGGDVELEPGIYVIQNGALNISADKQIIAEGVTFLLDGTVDAVNIRGEGVSLVAPKDGPTAGLAIAQNQGLVVTNAAANITGNFDLEGVLYMPNFDLTLKQEAYGVHRSPYIQMVTNTLTLTGQSNLDIKFNLDETELPMVIQPERVARLVE